MKTVSKCRNCSNPLHKKFVDLGFAPPSNAYLSESQLSEPELYFPLRVLVCTRCWLVQTEDYASRERLFSSSYGYLSSVSKSWLSHAMQYVEKIIPLVGLEKTSFVIELASNDGYLLKNFVSRGIPCLGIEPTESTNSIARANGIPVLEEFFSEQLAANLVAQGRLADLVIGNNVLAHVPDICDFVAGVKLVLKPGGTFTFEFPHLLELIRGIQFDTIYHEHYSYLSLVSVAAICQKAGLKIYRVEQLPTHGGSLRIYGSHQNSHHVVQHTVTAMHELEVDFGLKNIETYDGFQEKVDSVKNDFLSTLLSLGTEGKKIVAYGAAAKGNTLLNYAGVKTDLIGCVFDGSVYKQGRCMPGSHIPIVSPDEIALYSPDYILILPWNIRDEIIESIRSRVGSSIKFITAIPEVMVSN